MKQLILPSLLAKSQAELKEDLKKLKGIVKEIHLDIVDGQFAFNKTFQFPFKLSPSFRYSAHLMVKNPWAWIKKNKRKIDLLIPHFETIKDKDKYLEWTKKNKKKVAWAILPETKIKLIKPYLKKTDYVLVLTVSPGFYGSKFRPAELKKIKQIKRINPKIKVIVDGGIEPKTVKKAFQAGGDLFVSGSYTTKAENPKERIKQLTKQIT